MAAKPIILFAAPTAHGHLFPLLPHAAHLSNIGYDVFVINSTEFEAAIRRTGAGFYPTENPYTPEALEEFEKIPVGPERLIWGLKAHFIDPTPNRMKALKEALEDLREKYPSREVIIVHELVFQGAMPFLLGAPLPKGYDKFPQVIGFGTTPLLISSVDTAPFGPGLPPDSSEEGRARNAAMYEAGKSLQQDLTAYANKVYAELGATTKITGTMFDKWSTAYDVTVVPCSPSLEYPRSDFPSCIRFIGGTPPKKVDPSMPLPEWWGELETNKQAANPKKVVFVTQGTFSINYNSLLIPTIKTLGDREDLIIVATLGVKGSKLDGVEVPSNTKVVDYLLYEAMLPYTDVFVTNAGYSGFISGVMHGVPMLLAGTGQDKAEVSMRGEWAGNSVNLRTDKPSAEAIRDGVNKLLTDSSMKARSLEIQRENQELNCVVQLEKIIREFE